jgi:ABC-type transporter Mla MlaB component
VTLAEVARWRSALIDGLARGHGLRLDLTESGPWDLAGVQLLVATVASGKRSGQPIVLAHVPKVLMVVVERAALRDQVAAIAVE